MAIKKTSALDLQGFIEGDIRRHGLHSIIELFRRVKII